MRLQQLDLTFFGHFTNKQFDFGSYNSDVADFHIVYGSNEAGKTTFMEGYLRLLFGFEPKNEPYAFRHGRANLHVSGQLNIQGELRTFQRNSKRRNSLLDEHGSALPEAALLSHLGGLGMEDYRKLLCIDDDTIDRGGEEIVNSQGDIGKLLFSAAAGISDLSKVLESVRSEADALYKARASKTRLAVLKKEYADVVKLIKELDVPAGKLRQYTEAVQHARTAESTALAARRKITIDYRLLESRHRALPLMAQLMEQKQAVDNVAGYPERIDATSQQIIDMQKVEHQALAAIERLDRRCTELVLQLEQLPEENPFAGLGDALESLSELQSRYNHAQLELESTVADYNAVKATMSSLVLKQLNTELNPIELVVETDIIRALQASLETQKELQTRVAEERFSISRLDVSLEDENARFKSLEHQQPAGEGIAELLDRYRADVLEAEYKSATDSIEQSHQQVEVALDDLILQGRRPASLPDCTLTLDEAEELAERWQHLETQASARSAQILIDQQANDALIVERDQLQNMEGLVSDEHAQQRRQDRDAAWQSHKQTLDTQSADAFERLMIEFDQVMSGRLSNARDLARLRDLQRQIINTTTQIDTANASINSTVLEQQSLMKKLIDSVPGAMAETTITPKVIIRWLRRYHEASAQVHSAERLVRKHQPTLDKANELQAELATFTHRENITLTEQLSAANHIRIAYESYKKNLYESRSSVLQKQDALKAAELKLSELLDTAEQAQKDWKSLVENTFPANLDVEKLALSVGTLTTLRELNVEREALVKSIRKMQLDGQLFSQKLEDLILHYGLESANSADSNWKLLQKNAADADQHIRSRAALQQELTKAREEIKDNESGLSELQSQRVILAELFDASVATTNLKQLYDAVQTAQHASMLRQQYEQTKQSLFEELGVSTLEEAYTALQGLDANQVKSQLNEKESDIEHCSMQCTAATEARTRSEADLASLTGDGQVAHLVEQRTTLELQMTEAALDYLKLSLGHRLAEQAINRYREKHRSGMLEATETAFAQLTNGRYASLQTQSDGEQEALRALDKDGNAKRADEMSKGTRFQLYLALRSAAYDQLVEQGTCLPFICDDIFETFDEDRTRAACKVMQRIGLRGQAIYLTHHRHVVDIAQEICKGGVQILEL